MDNIESNVCFKYLDGLSKQELLVERSHLKNLICMMEERICEVNIRIVNSYIAPFEIGEVVELTEKLNGRYGKGTRCAIVIDTEYPIAYLKPFKKDGSLSLRQYPFNLEHCNELFKKID